MGTFPPGTKKGKIEFKHWENTFFYYVCTFILFPPFISVHPLLGLDHHNFGRPLRVAGVMLYDAIACRANLCTAIFELSLYLPFSQNWFMAL